MTGTVCLAIEGVLASAGRVPIVQRAVDPEARKFYSVISAGYRLVLLTEAPILANDQVRWWLQTSGIVGFDDLVFAPSGEDDLVGIRYRQVTALRASRVDVSLVVDSDPLVVTMAMQQGMNGLLWGRARPPLMRGDLRKQPIRSWDSIVDEVNAQREYTEERG